jgi:hypothetical protein
MALSTLDKIKKRRAFPVTIGDETVSIRAMSKADIKRLSDLTDAPDEFILGLVLLDDVGNPAFAPNEGESDRAFAERVAAETVDVPHITKKEIYAAVRKVSGYIVEELEKN